MNRSKPRIDSSPRETNVTTREPAGIERLADRAAAPARAGRGAVSIPSKWTSIFEWNRDGNDDLCQAVAE